MNKYLFLFTIGPVQTFIAEARKTVDLYNGSKLLSDLINKAVEEAGNEDNSMKVIFPAQNIKSKPNRFICIIETDNPDDFGKAIEQKVREEFKNIASEILTKSNCDKPQNFDEQIENFLEIYWVMLPFNNEDEYAEKYKEIESLLGAIKNVRSFKQNSYSEDGRKCSLCGKKNALFYKKTAKNKKPAFIQNDACEVNSYFFNFGEGLCAVCYTKRMYKKTQFPSVAKIALMDWLEKIPKNEIDSFKKQFSQNFNEELYYEENLREEFFKKNKINCNNLKDAKKILNTLYEKYDKPKKYYAITMFDGDNMGKWLSGEFLNDKSNLKDFHEKISEKLGKYADSMEELIKNPKGSLVYAGGDDVLAFLNLDTFLDTLKEIRDNYPNFIDNKEATGSAGVVIAHYKMPLLEVLKWARKMEREAKAKGGRDALAIAVLKHSGEIEKAVYKWKIETDDKERYITDIMKDLVKELQDDEEGFSSSFINNFIEEFRKFNDLSHEKIVKTELKRLLYRASILENKDKKKEKSEKWKNILFDLFFSKEEDKDNLFHFLKIADFLSRRLK